MFAAAPASGKKKKKKAEEEEEEEEEEHEEEEEEAPKVGRAMRDGRHPGGKRWQVVWAGAWEAGFLQVHASLQSLTSPWHAHPPP